MNRLERLSPCKVNLLLNILGRRPDGFHELETLFFPLPLHDRLVFETTASGSGIGLTCTHPELPTGPENLVYRAAQSFFAATGLPPAVRIHLEKNLPLAAGLGAGSANAAVTLDTLNEMHGRPLSTARLHELAAALGSDVPFFLQGRPALAFGRGERLESLPELPALKNLAVLLVHPGFGVSTAWAYRALADFPEALNGRPGRARQLAEALLGGTLAEAAPHFYNALEAPVLRKYPLLQWFQDFFREQGAVVALMSGSGSTTFALLPTLEAAEKARASLQAIYQAPLWSAIVTL
ncbi:4-(cytidine 5'-diphospho)-2-C-methyl-D-erythritol kinase [Fontisphaera persica]|uniref:4-(cytidine 5'-diphospho)-2-C-methyl-D-erythritol kinase n=1 Tax=Fontisphaera persica TaxID=2974023 RepID=UPI0024BFD900|nr:4-(cytidine 5'-diphospho)-2-C-methyl-D-erythritol kinase [Fontisphaera persica]WCJ58412.1 4-(cytidine 5'-diphospho)-2-C-methyl-D-erythritol kinase [Fontisphaera persica]